MAPHQQALVLIESRDLDTDERKQVTLPAVRPAAAPARERELRALIEQVHPGSQFRSFAEDVASALSRQHLVVAHYVGDAPKVVQEPPSEQIGDQDELFAA